VGLAVTRFLLASLQQQAEMVVHLHLPVLLVVVAVVEVFIQPLPVLQLVGVLGILLQ
jgi:hypothetical protein